MKIARGMIGALALVACDAGAGPELTALREQLAAQDERLTALQGQVDRMTEELAAERAAGVRDAMAALSMLKDDAPPQPPVDLEPPPTPGVDAAALASITCAGDRCTIPRAAFDALIADPDALARQARFMPSLQDGVTRGFKVYGVRPGSPVKAIGLKNGDLVTELAGKKLQSVEDALAAWAVVRVQSEWSIKGERAGAPFERTIAIAK